MSTNQITIPNVADDAAISKEIKVFLAALNSGGGDPMSQCHLLTQDKFWLAHKNLLKLIIPEFRNLKKQSNRTDLL